MIGMSRMPWRTGFSRKLLAKYNSFGESIVVRGDFAEGVFLTCNGEILSSYSATIRMVEDLEAS